MKKLAIFGILLILIGVTINYKEDILSAVKKAADFVEKSVRVSSHCGISHKEGIAFEKCIADLIRN